MQAQYKAKIFFNYVLIWFALVIVSLAIGDILFAYIDIFTGKKSVADEYGVGNLRMAVASLIIGIPILSIISAYIQKNINNKVFDAESSIRSWMIYIILAFSSIVFLVTLCFLVYDLLSGEFDIRQILKILTILSIAGIIVCYYLFDIARPSSAQSFLKRLLNYTLLLAMLGVLVMGVFQIPGLKEAKGMRSDLAKRSQIQKIERQAQRFYSENHKLPNSLNVLVEKNYLHADDIKDSETNNDFIYKVTSRNVYQICAKFHHKHKDQYSAQWSHPEGQHCFKFIIRVKEELD